MFKLGEGIPCLKMVWKNTIDVYIKMKEGEDVTGMRAKVVKNGNAKVSMEIEKGKKVIGVDVENYG